MKFEENIMSIDKVTKLLAEQLNIDPKTIKPTSKIVEDLGADSLDMIELLMSLEDEFGISVPDNQVASLKTVKDIVTFIDNNTKK